MNVDRETITRMLVTQVAGAPSEQELFDVVYDELRRVAGALLRDERTALEPTGLVHEAWIRMIDPSAIEAEDPVEMRRRFVSLAARAMRRVLIDHARRRDADKRGGGRRNVTLAESVVGAQDHSADLLDLDAALTKLEEWKPRLARIAELRLLGGLSSIEVGKALGISESTASAEWKLARALLNKHLA